MQIPTGDKLLRRVAEVLRSAFRAEDVVARIGGDEFAALMPATDETAAAQTMERIQTLINLNNKYYRGPVLSLSVGVALAVRGQSLTEAQRLADDRMYRRKTRPSRGGAPLTDGREKCPLAYPNSSRLRRILVHLPRRDTPQLGGSFVNLALDFLI
ncbi:MAG: GGDEF domain-containing protein [Chloroflexi bacterium]|nr:GGDEF domain-containing protein [Chloroflexota bacterium]